MKSKKVNILIVDDNPKNIYALEQMLAKAGRTFLTTTSGAEALKIALNKDIDLILLDVQMPQMDGFEVAQILKMNNRTKEVPIIFVSAEKKEHKFIMKGFEEGGMDYLYKPLDPEITEAKVDVLLDLQLKKKELVSKNAALEKYALLINNSADIICIINAETLKFEEVNVAAHTILGYTAEELKYTSLLLYLSEEDRLKVQAKAKKNEENFSFETQVYSKSRNIKWLNWNIVNRKGFWFANARDITGIKEVEEIKNYLSVVVKQSKDAVYLHNEEGKIISWNNGAVAIYGYSEMEALNMKIWNIVPEFLMAEAHNIVENILRGEQIESLETKRITKYGKIIDVIFSASVITDANGTLRSVAITERDITQQKKLDNEIRQLNLDLKRNLNQLELTNKELESFSYSISHDLRAPLRAINGYAQIIQNEFNASLDEELKKLFNIIQNNAIKMGALIDDLLAFSKLGRGTLNKSSVDLNEVVGSVIQELDSDEMEKLHINVHPLPSAEGDRALLAQVFVNLISNAIKYSGKKPEQHIEINSFEQDGENVYFIKDNGAGFNMEYADKLFGVFQRLHSDEEFEGTGVGLAIVQRIITRHGGKVWAESEPGKGATFYFSLPKDYVN